MRPARSPHALEPEKKRDPAAFARAGECLARFPHAAHAEALRRMLLDESRFGVTPPVRRAWTPRGMTHAVSATPHSRRLTALGALELDGPLHDALVAGAARASAWLIKGLRLHVLPAYSPELNPIEILWKHAKHFWRHFVARQPASLHDEVDR